jgi:hypothetical protein
VNAVTLTLDTTALLENSNTLVLEISRADLGDDFDAFLGLMTRTPEGRPVVVLPAGQRPEISDSVVRQLLQRTNGTAGDQS